MFSNRAVKVNDREISVLKLSANAEYGLGVMLGRRAKAEMGPGGYFARLAPALDWLRETKRTAEWSAALAEATRLQAAPGVDSDDLEAYRQTPAGLACEIFHRTRQTAPDVTEADLLAIITDVNALDIYRSLMDALTDEKKS
jgi:hypothetical protein